MYCECYYIKNSQEGDMQKQLNFSKFISILLSVLVFVITPFFHAPVQAQSGICQAEFQSVALPLTELGSQEYTRMDGQATGFSGGLYPNGKNTRPAAHEKLGIAAAKSIQALDQTGKPDSRRGKIVMISIGMSNANYEFETFLQNAHSDEDINPHLVLINGALPGQTSDRWVDPAAPAWLALSETLTRYEVAPPQVQVAWIKETQTGAGDFPAKARAVEADLKAIVHNLFAAYPNIKIVYFSSRIYSYTYFHGLSPEPNAYETGFSVKWLIEKQINGDPTLNNDPVHGEVTAPFLSWGPYLWADGENARADGLQWLPEDLTNDCTHPSASGRQKVAGMLLTFLKTDTTSLPWFLKNPPVQDKLYLPLISTATVTPPELTPVPIPSRAFQFVATLTPGIVLSTPIPETSGGLLSQWWLVLSAWIQRFLGQR